MAKKAMIEREKKRQKLVEKQPLLYWKRVRLLTFPSFRSCEETEWVPRSLPETSSVPWKE